MDTYMGQHMQYALVVLMRNEYLPGEITLSP